MKIVISGMAGSGPVVLDGIKALLLAGDDGRKDGSAPCIAQGDRRALAQLAAVVLASVRMKLGDDAFRAVVSAAQGVSLSQMADVIDTVCRGPRLEK